MSYLTFSRMRNYVRPVSSFAVLSFVLFFCLIFQIKSYVSSLCVYARTELENMKTNIFLYSVVKIMWCNKFEMLLSIWKKIFCRLGEFFYLFELFGRCNYLWLMGFNKILSAFVCNCVRCPICLFQSSISCLWENVTVKEHFFYNDWLDSQKIGESFKE